MKPGSFSRTLLLFCVVIHCLAFDAASAQSDSDTDSVRTEQALSLDARLVYEIYNTDSPGFSRYMRAADATAYPAFVVGPIVLWGDEWIERGEEEYGAAYRMLLSEALSGAIGFVLKSSIRKARPYVSLHGIYRRRRDVEGPKLFDPYDFPSGHSTLAFSQATSLSLSFPRWYVIVPSYVWASSVGVSRVWFGMHYPSAVIAGAVLGTIVATGVHLARSYITPDFLTGEGEQRQIIAFSLRF